MAQSLGEKLKEMDQRFDELERKLSDPQVASQGQLYPTLLKEHGRLTRVVQSYRAWKRAHEQIKEAEAILSDPGSDNDLREMAQEEAQSLREEATRLRDEVKRLAVAEESAPDRDAIVEIRAGTGGEEAALFAADLLRMYTRYAERRGWKVSPLDARPTDLGGFKEVTVCISGPNAYRQLRFESGGHRVQRVPTTEAQGRIHTSLVTVAVLPDAEDVDVQISPEDLEISFYRAGGPGGQKVNKTSSAVRIIHKPTGIEAACQDSPSQHKNRAAAMRVLRARVMDSIVSKQEAERAEERRTMIGSGDRSARIRTYNFPQNRITDHRVGLSVHNMTEVLDGGLDVITEALLEYELAEREKGIDLE